MEEQDRLEEESKVLVQTLKLVVIALGLTTGIMADCKAANTCLLAEASHCFQ